MALNRLNVLHWHIEDSYSFPLVSRRFPLLSDRGAWDKSQTYSLRDVAGIVEAARLRGVRVIPELDIPGHTYSWGLAYPNLTVACPPKVTSDIGTINSVGLDMTKEETYALVEGLLQELAGVFRDSYMHLGGDEVQFECYNKTEVGWVWKAWGKGELVNACRHKKA